MKLLRRTPPASSARPISLALQGGGAHGAFQWGVLDRLIEFGGLDIQSITAASAGAMNAVALVWGMLEGGPDGARSRLESFWRAVSQGGSRGVFGENLVASLATDWFTNNPAYKYMEALTSQVAVSPYDFNPLNINPLRDILREQIDFKAIREQSTIDLFIAATGVRTNEAKLFHAAELTAEHVMASACLPDVFQAVEIDGEPYWDGGYSANPPLIPLVLASKAAQLLIVQVMPTNSARLPTSPGEIAKRLEQIHFNATLNAELEALKYGMIIGATPKLRRLRIGRISAQEEFAGLADESAGNLGWDFLERLRASGAGAVEAWLEETPRGAERERPRAEDNGDGESLGRKAKV